jgi:molybdopterin-guanine dinucleotide biosynthesis protein A
MNATRSDGNQSPHVVDVYFPMAGQGARFGHRFKPFLEIGGETFIEAAVRPFRDHVASIRRFVFIFLAEQEREHGVRSRIGDMFRGLPHTSVLLAAPTRGPAETIGNAVRELAPTTRRAFVCDCDHSLDVAPLFRFAAERPFDVLLPVWSLEGESLASWSVASVDAEQRVRAIAEKQLPKSPAGTATTPMGVIGCYGFRDIVDVAHRAAALGATNFSDVIAQLLGEGAAVHAATIERATFFGDPNRLARAQS